MGSGPVFVFSSYSQRRRETNSGLGQRFRGLARFYIQANFLSAKKLTDQSFQVDDSLSNCLELRTEVSALSPSIDFGRVGFNEYSLRTGHQAGRFSTDSGFLQALSGKSARDTPPA